MIPLTFYLKRREKSFIPKSPTKEFLFVIWLEAFLESLSHPKEWNNANGEDFFRLIEI